MTATKHASKPAKRAFSTASKSEPPAKQAKTDDIKKKEKYSNYHVSKGFESSSAAPKEKPIEGSDAAKNDHHAQKVLRLQRKAGKTPLFELIQELKKSWEQFRMKHIAKPERRQIVLETMKLIKGHVLDVIFKHDASRIIQALIKYSDPANETFGRSAVFAELKGSYVELAKSPYGRFVVLKALKYAPNSKARSEITAEFLKPQTIPRLIRHKFAELVVDTIYCLYANAKEKQAMVEQFYGVEYQLVRTTIGNIKGSQNSAFDQVLAVSGTKSKRIFDQMKDILTGIVLKEGHVGRNEIVHRILYDYFSHMDFDTLASVIGSETAAFHSLLEQIPTFIHTKYGTQVAMILISGSTAKERKAILKAIKPHARNMALNEFGWQTLCRIVDCVDDTVLIKNCILNELVGKDKEDDIAELFLSKNARKFFMYLVKSRDTKYFSPDLLASLSTGEKYSAKTSKKDPVQRRREIMDSFFPRFMACVSNARVLPSFMRDWGCCVALLDVIKYAVEHPDYCKESSVDALLALIMDSCREDVVWPLVLAEEESAVVEAEDSDDSDDDGLLEEVIEEQEDEAPEEAPEMEPAVAAKEEEEEEYVEEEEELEEQKPLEISKNYLETAPKKPIVLRHVFIDDNASRFIKRLLVEQASFATLLEAHLSAKETVQGLLKLDSETEAFPAGPFFILLALSEKSEQVKNLLVALVKASAETLKESPNKGVQTLMRHLDMK